MLLPRKIRRVLNTAKRQAARKAYVMRMKKAERIDAFAYYAAAANRPPGVGTAPYDSAMN